MFSILNLPEADRAEVLRRVFARCAFRGDCLIWNGGVNNHGYGQLYVSGQKRLVSRIMYESAKGQLASGQCALHQCDTPACVNPAHLFPGTKRDNSKDMVRKGRVVLARFGTTPDSVIAGVRRIRRLVASGTPYADIAAEVVTSIGRVAKIARGESWGDLEWLPDEVNPSARQGTKKRGERNGRAKATEEQVREIRRRLASGVKQSKASMAREMNLPVGVVRHIAGGKTWSHVAA